MVELKLIKYFLCIALVLDKTTSKGRAIPGKVVSKKKIIPRLKKISSARETAKKCRIQSNPGISRIARKRSKVKEPARSSRSTGTTDNKDQQKQADCLIEEKQRLNPLWDEKENKQMVPEFVLLPVDDPRVREAARIHPTDGSHPINLFFSVNGQVTMPVFSIKLLRTIAEKRERMGESGNLFI